jgi:ubiquinone/menaquinone biosynthesis C-methylase UbiE
MDIMNKLSDYLFYRKRVCPWWICFTFDNVLRKLFHDPDQILRPYINEGDVVLDIGPGMGYFTIPMAKMVGENGRVIAADIQEKMLSALEKRAIRSGVQQRITLHLCSSDSLGVKSEVDFILAFWMMHEVPDKQRFLAELHSLLKDNGYFLLVEPIIHTTKADFEESVCLAGQAGFTQCKNPEIFFCRGALFKKTRK